MVNVKQILEMAFVEKKLFIKVIELEGEDPATLAPLDGKLRFTLGNHTFGVLITNASDDADDPHRDNIAEIAATAIQELEYEMITEFHELTINEYLDKDKK